LSVTATTIRAYSRHPSRLMAANLSLLATGDEVIE
jgi:hypothetical protein